MVQGEASGACGWPPASHGLRLPMTLQETSLRPWTQGCYVGRCKGERLTSTRMRLPWYGCRASGQLPSRCVGPQPGSPCLGDRQGHDRDPPAPGPGLPGTSAVSAGRPRTPHWVPTATARTWGWRESSCCSGSLPLTAPRPRRQAGSVRGTVSSLEEGHMHEPRDSQGWARLTLWPIGLSSFPALQVEPT